MLVYFLQISPGLTKSLATLAGIVSSVKRLKHTFLKIDYSFVHRKDGVGLLLEYTPVRNLKPYTIFLKLMSI